MHNTVHCYTTTSTKTTLHHHPVPPLSFPSRTDFSIRILTFKALLILLPPPELISELGSHRVNICSESRGFIEIVASFRGLSGGRWIENLLSHVSQARRNQMHYILLRGSWCDVHFKVPSYVHSICVSGLKYAASSEVKPRHGGSGIVLQEGPGFKPEPPSVD